MINVVQAICSEQPVQNARTIIPYLYGVAVYQTSMKLVRYKHHVTRWQVIKIALITFQNTSKIADTFCNMHTKSDIDKWKSQLTLCMFQHWLRLLHCRLRDRWSWWRLRWRLSGTLPFHCRFHCPCILLYSNYITSLNVSTTSEINCTDWLVEYAIH